MKFPEPTESQATDIDQDGYLLRTTADNGREVGIMPFLFTWAIIADITDAGYSDRWCYHTLQDAIAAFATWDGEGEPTGWHRHPNSGRRRDEDGNIYVCR